jgi:hypothetical protein
VTHFNREDGNMRVANQSFREKNAKRREKMAFEALYKYAKRVKLPDPKRKAQRAAKRIHKVS